MSKKSENKMKNKIIKAWIIGRRRKNETGEYGKWATKQILIYKTKKSAQDRIYQGGMAEVWEVYPCEIKIKK